MNMDLQTLRISHAVVLGCYTVLTLANSKLHRGSRGVRLFPLYSLCVFLAALLVALRSSIPRVLSVVVGDVFFSLGYVFLFWCLAESFGVRRVRWTLQGVCVGLMLCGATWYGQIVQDPRKLLVIFSAILIAQLVPSAILSFRHARGPVGVASAWMGVVLALLSLSNLVRLLGLLPSAWAARSLNSDSLIAWTLLDNSALQGGVTVAFVWMTAGALQHSLAIEATTDPLTGLMNRRAAIIAADHAIEVGRQLPEQMSAILIDLDQFKELNDRFGHLGGDQALVEVAHRMERCVRGGDMVARLGGDEFVVLLPATSLVLALTIAERLRASFVQTPVIFGAEPMTVTASCGVAQVQGATLEWRQLFTACDLALYEAKRLGGNQVSPAESGSTARR